MMSGLKPSIPKFGSFKPKPTSSSQDQAEKEIVESHHDRHDIKDLHDYRQTRKGQSKNFRRKSPKARRSSSKPRDLVETQQSLPPREAIEEFFIIDRKGDVKNLVYGSNHRYSVPAFHRSGAGSVLGIPSYLRIDRDYDDGKGIVLHDRRHFKSRHREKYIFSKIEKERPRLLKLRSDIKIQDSSEQDYVSFQTSRGKKRMRGADPSSGSEDGETNYRSIYKAKSNDAPEDKSFQYATESDSGSENDRMIELDVVARQKTVALSRAVEQVPHDVAAWLALIDHQDIVLTGDQRRATNAELKGTADSMYFLGLEYTPSYILTILP